MVAFSISISIHILRLDLDVHLSWSNGPHEIHMKISHMKKIAVSCVLEEGYKICELSLG